MNLFLFLLILLLLIIIYTLSYKPPQENFEGTTNNILSSYKEPIMNNNEDPSYLQVTDDFKKEIAREKDLIEDENIPFFDDYNLACILPYKSPLMCANITGNYVNVFPLSYCKNICPEQIKKYHATKKDLLRYERKIDELKEAFDNKWEQKKYYCWNGKTCTEHDYNYLDPSKNKCGQNMISQVPLFVYDNKERCMKDNTQCKDLSKSGCLQRSDCGWCTNSLSEGICVKGTPMGPINYNLPCWPSTGKSYNNYTGGVPNQFKN